MAILKQPGGEPVLPLALCRWSCHLMTLSFRELQQQLRPEWGREHDGNGVDFDLLMEIGRAHV